VGFWWWFVRFSGAGRAVDLGVVWEITESYVFSMAKILYV
jgi:hypothetical protein